MERAKIEEQIYINVADWMHERTNQELCNLPFFTSSTYDA